MSNYDISKLKRSLAVKVQNRLQALLPEAVINGAEDDLNIKYDGIDGHVSLNAMVEVCHGEDRELWGAIAGSYCNLVVSRIMSSLVPSMDAESDLADIWLSLVPENEIEDRMISEATPRDELLVCSRPWMTGFRMECDFDGAQGHRRVLRRDLVGIDLSEDELFAQAQSNMASFVSQAQFRALGTEGAEKNVLQIKAAGSAPAILACADTHKSLFDWFEREHGDETGHLVAVAPRTDTLLCCRARDRHAAATMVGHAWRFYDREDDVGIPLSIRTFSIVAPGELKFEDMGRSESELNDWNTHHLGSLLFRSPDDWNVEDIGSEHWKISSASKDAGPSVTVQVLEHVKNGEGHICDLALEASQPESGQAANLGFFNGVPWVKVDQGNDEGINRSILYVGARKQVMTIETAVPTGCAMPDIVTMQKVITSIKNA